MPFRLLLLRLLKEDLDDDTKREVTFASAYGILQQNYLYGYQKDAAQNDFLQFLMSDQRKDQTHFAHDSKESRRHG